jgi:hypothetical protein
MKPISLAGGMSAVPGGDSPPRRVAVQNSKETHLSLEPLLSSFWLICFLSLRWIAPDSCFWFFPSGKRFYLSVMAIFRTEGPYLAEWIEYI